MHARHKTITHEELGRALARFHQEGRQITQLAAQPTPSRTNVRVPGNAVGNLLDLVLPELFTPPGSDAPVT